MGKRSRCQGSTYQSFFSFSVYAKDKYRIIEPFIDDFINRTRISHRQIRHRFTTIGFRIQVYFVKKYIPDYKSELCKSLLNE